MIFNTSIIHLINITSIDNPQWVVPNFFPHFLQAAAVDFLVTCA